MVKPLILCGAILAFAGCERPTFTSPSVGAERVEQTVILSGFGQTDTVVVGLQGYRVGLYHDFSGYDSLRINFMAAQGDLEGLAKHILLRVGPTNYFLDSLLALQKDFSILVNCSQLAKPRFSALTFYCPDDEGILLSNLRVIGFARISY